MILHAFRRHLAEELDKIPADAEQAFESYAVTTAALARRLLEYLAIDDLSVPNGFRDDPPDYPLGACAVEVLMLGDWRAAAGEVGLWPECGHLARPTLGCKSQSGRPERKRFAFHTRSMGTARPGASALAGQHLPQHVATVPIRLMFNAKHTRSHSPRTFAKPRRLNRRNPSTSLIHPFGASESHLRCAYRALPAGLASFSPMRCHSFASRALALGESLTMIGKLLGHTKIQTTARYAHLARDSIKLSAAKVAASIGADILPAGARPDAD